MRKPFTTIVMPICNEISYINQSLEAVLDQNYPADLYEVIIADGMSNDGTRGQIKAKQEIYKNLILIDNHGLIVPKGLNAAISQAKGEIIIRVDGHTIIDEDYVSQCVAELQRTGADNVGGRMSAVGLNRFAQAVALATSSPFGVGGARFHYADTEEWVDTVYLGAWRKEVFKLIGLFDEQLVRDQDDEFNYRLLSKGGKILLSPRIKSRYFVRSNIYSLSRQYFQYGYWKIRVLQKHPRQMRLRQFVPPTFVGILLITMLLSFFTSYSKLLLILISVSYVISNILASVWLAYQKGWKHLLLLPLVYSILHISYGFGFLAGIVRFITCWQDKQGQVPYLQNTSVD